MAVPLETFMLNLLGQAGDRYVYGSEASPLDPDPDRFDCSELIQWAGARSGVQPPIPDGSSAQWEHVRAGRIPVERALVTRGALLWHPGHVAVSLGNKTTIEARGRLYGVGTWASTGRFQGAGLFPGIDYARPEDDVTPEQDKLLHDAVIFAKAALDSANEAKELAGKALEAVTRPLAPLTQRGYTDNEARPRAAWARAGKKA